jgi:hypothetical protein
MRTKKKRVGTSALIVASVVAAGVAAAAVLSGQGNAGPSTPRSISALNQLPAATAPPLEVAQWVGLYEAHGQVAPDAEVTQLRSDLGSRGSDVWAFKNTRGGVCFLYVDFAGNCSSAKHLRQTGIQWTVGAGVLVAVVTDDVERVTLTVDGTTHPVSLANNVVFAEYADANAESAQIAVTYANGATETSMVRLRGAFPTPPN